MLLLSFCIILSTTNERIHSHIAWCSSYKAIFDNTSATFTVDIDRFQMDWQLICTLKLLWCWKHWQCHYIYIKATPQQTKVSFETVLSTFYSYFAYDAWKFINYCKHCRKLKCIHYYSCHFRLFMFYYKSNSICKTITACNTCIYIYWYTSSIFLDNKYSLTISW